MDNPSAMMILKTLSLILKPVMDFIHWLENNDFLDNFNKEGGANLGQLPLLKTQSYFKQTHIFFEMNELVRYIMFRDRLHKKWEKAS